MSISLQSGAMKLESLTYLKYNVLKWKNRLTLGISAAKNTDCMKKKLELKVVKNSIPYKKLSERTCLSPPQCGAWGLERLLRLKYYNVLKRENRLN